MSTEILEPISPPRPRWAREIPDDNWERIGYLVKKGWSAPAILRELSLPPSKTRSLQVYARKFTARRRIAQFDTFRDALADASADSAQDLRCAFRHIVQLIGDEDVLPNNQIRAFEAIAEFTRVFGGLMKHDQDLKINPINDEDDQDPVDQWEVISEAIRRVYGLDMDNPPKPNPFNNRGDTNSAQSHPLQGAHGEPRASARADVASGLVPGADDPNRDREGAASDQSRARKEAESNEGSALRTNQCRDRKGAALNSDDGTSPPQQESIALNTNAALTPR